MIEINYVTNGGGPEMPPGMEKRYHWTLFLFDVPLTHKMNRGWPYGQSTGNLESHQNTPEWKSDQQHSIQM